VEKYAPAMQETKVQSLGVEHPLEEEMATHSSTPAWRTWSTSVHGVAESDMNEGLSTDRQRDGYL